MTEEVKAYGQKMYQLGQRNAFQSINNMLAKRLEKIPTPEPKTDIPSTPETTAIENVDWGIETLRLGIPIVRILKRHAIHTLKDLTKKSSDDLQAYKGLGIRRVTEISNAVRRNGMTLREP
jgi:DNA-directed RNA polymerase alpha subunit